MTQAAFAQPEMSWRRKTSISTVMAIQKKMNHAVMIRMSQKMFRNGYEVATTNTATPICRFRGSAHLSATPTR